MEKTIGTIIHYGLYSEPGYDSVKSERRRRMNNGSEWYLKRLTENSDYRPISGHKETKKYHTENYGYIDYYDFKINPVEENIEEWLKISKKIGAKYSIITAKHHDSYCLWPTKYGPSHNIDVVKIFKKYCEKYDISFGIYFSWYEFKYTFTKKFISDVVDPQINELLSYGPKRIFFDGHWCIKSQYGKDYVNKLVDKIRSMGIIINDRYPYINDPSYKNFGDRYIPDKMPECNWEWVGTIGLSWGYNRDQEESDYKNGEELKEIYDKVMKLNGNFLINIGPKEDCSIDLNELKSLCEFSKIIE